MRKTYGLMGVLLALSIGGYLLPETKEALPGRILMPNAGGRVVFDHGAHNEGYGLACVQCHHDIFKPASGKSCLACHDKNMAVAKVPCKACHGADFAGGFKASHTAMAEDRQVCVTCHHAWFTPRNEERRAIPHGGQACGYVPEDGGQGGEASGLPLKEAAHARCAECHEAMLTGDVQNCAMCHSVVDAEKQLRDGKSVDAALVSCSSCHEEEPKKLIPNSMAAYHGLCIGCHREKGGPVDECSQCHMK